MRSDRDYYTETDREGNTLTEPIPLLCSDCGRPAYYDLTDESYHHALEPAIGCFLIGAEKSRSADPNHPLAEIAGKVWLRTK